MHISFLLAAHCSVHFPCFYTTVTEKQNKLNEMADGW